MPSITRDSRTVSYTDSGGDGPAVVLLHAFPLNSKQWDGQVESLSLEDGAVTVEFRVKENAAKTKGSAKKNGSRNTNRKRSRRKRSWKSERSWSSPHRKRIRSMP